MFWGFFWYTGFNPVNIKLIQFVGVLVLIIYLFKEIFLTKYHRNSYSRIIRLLIFLIFISILNALVFWDQSPVLTCRAGVSAFVLLYYFMLKKINASYEIIIKLIIIFAIVHIILWLYAVSQAPNVVFGILVDEIGDSRGFYRIIGLNGKDAVYLLYFILLTQFIGFKSSKKIKFLFFLIIILLFFIIILSLSRAVILGIMLITIYYIFKKKPVLLILLFILTVWGSDLIMKNEVFSILTTMTQTEFGEGDKSALRIVEYTGFFKYYPWNFLTTLFGHGSPHVNSSYGQYEELIKYSYGFNRSDAGYVYLIVTYGVSAILLYLNLGLKVFRQKVNLSTMPFKLYVLFIFFISVAGNSFVSNGVGLAISLYVLEQSRIKQKCISKNTNRGCLISN